MSCIAQMAQAKIMIVRRPRSRRRRRLRLESVDSFTHHSGRNLHAGARCTEQTFEGMEGDNSWNGKPLRMRDNFFFFLLFFFFQTVEFEARDPQPFANIQKRESKNFLFYSET